MEYDSASNCEEYLRDSEASEDCSRFRITQPARQPTCTTSPKPWSSLQVMSSRPPLKFGRTNNSLSSEAMEYYQKYSQSSNLDKYFSLPANSSPPETVKYYYSIYDSDVKLDANRQDCIGQEFKRNNIKSVDPRERKKIGRPPLIGQSSSGEGSSKLIRSLINPESPSLELKSITSDTILEERNESQETFSGAAERKLSSPTSSIASHKPLEWDSGADVGYFNNLPNCRQSNKKLSTIERMALARGCSAALRLDPEGTTESGASAKIPGTQRNVKLMLAPDANSTPLIENASGSENEIEITPIVKLHLPGIITGSDIKSEERINLNKDGKQHQQSPKSQIPRKELHQETPKSTFTFKTPYAKCGEEYKPTACKRMVNKENICPAPPSPLKKSTSMNTLVIASSKQILKRSQSELNLYAKNKNKSTVPVIYNSSSSIATVVNKPTTCDKVIQTSLNACSQESIGVQVSVIEEEKPPLPKRGTSLQKSSQEIVKDSKGTYNIKNSKKQGDHYEDCDSYVLKQKEKRKSKCTSSEQSHNDSGARTPQLDEPENITGRANSFEYFPGHIYENVPNGSGSHISASDTGRSSSLPNTSSSINEKLWGDCDSLVKDLERSVNILKRLIDANKCDKEVKKRLIHHVVRRLIVAKYTDDKIEHNLEDNVPWNPDNTRSKVYKSEILDAFTKKHSISDSSQDWDEQKKSICTRKPIAHSTDIMKEVTIESSNSEKFDKNTDRTETDGRKARMSLRTEDCQQNSNTTTDRDKSGSSDCFFPQRGRKNNKVQDIFSLKEQCKRARDDTTSSSTVPDHNRILLDAVVNNRRTTIVSSNNTEENIDWRLFPTLSERQFELKKRTNSNSGDSKLVSYAEMEKRNQLIWITNEISHLCNLKKLLEQPRKPERSRTSPRKAKPATCKTKVSVLDHPRGSSREIEYFRRNTSDGQRNLTEEPWSSHCNLAAYRPTTSTTNSLIQRVKKRNSCAQTATNVTSAHSKTGGEIVSASNLHSSAMKLVSTGVQTIPQEVPAIVPTLIQSEIVHYIKCPAHNTALHLQNGCKCTDQIGQCHRHATQSIVSACVHCLKEQSQTPPILNCVQKQYANSECVIDDRAKVSQTPMNQTTSSSITSLDITHHCPARENTQQKQKELKNQINASKSKCLCECKAIHAAQSSSDYKCGSNETEEKSTEYERPVRNTCQMCSTKAVGIESSNSICQYEDCHKKAPRPRERKDTNVIKKCACMNTCDCENKRSELTKGCVSTRPVSQFYPNSNGYASTCNQNGSLKLCECSTDCSCENSREKTKMICGCHTTPTQQHNGAHHCGHYTKVEERLNQPRRSCVTTEISYQHEVQNGMKCNCEKECSCVHKIKTITDKSHDRVYSNKSNFVHETSSTSESERNSKFCRHCGTMYQNAKKCNCRQLYPKSIAYELSFTKNNQKNEYSGAVPKMPSSNQIPNGSKVNGCVCNVIKKDSSSKETSRKNTLQDYLSKNKPDFVGNAETRRQYMFEISHLRQLRKEKRIQLLAMASSSSIMKLPKVTTKPNASVQKKISDEQIRQRLRKRYLRLNEVRFKRRQQEKQEETRRNKLMAKIFCKKLQQKVLRGQVDLSQSNVGVSYISDTNT